MTKISKVTSTSTSVRRRAPAAQQLEKVGPDNARKRVRGTLSIESFWRAIDGDHNDERQR